MYYEFYSMLFSSKGAPLFCTLIFQMVTPKIKVLLLPDFSILAFQWHCWILTKLEWTIWTCVKETTDLVYDNSQLGLTDIQSSFSLPCSKCCNLIGWWSVKILWSWHFEVPRRYFLTLDTQQSKRRNANNGLRIVARNSPLTLIFATYQCQFHSMISDKFVCFYKLGITEVTRNMFWSSSSVMMGWSRTR